ncbi:MAG: AMP-binding protein [Gammaproteobacteria bacterium]|nr:AMP-binding protein [Gammaproteobacteria bacterium]
MNIGTHHVGRSYCHRGGEAPLLGHTISEHFAAVVQKFPAHEAVVSLPQKRRLNYRDLQNLADELARGLMSIGFRPGERIGIWSTNNIEWLLLQLATARIGVVLVNINPANRPRELAYALQRAGVQGLFLIPGFRGSDYVEMLGELVPELSTAAPDRLQSSSLPDLRRIVLYDPAEPMQTQRPAPGFTLWAEVLAAAGTVETAELEALTASLDMDDAINIQFTSGTTGFPKAVVLSHHNILNNAWFCAQAMYFTETDRLAVSVPFYHCFGMVLANLLCWSVGACIVIPGEHFDAQQVLEAIATEHCTAVHGVPTMFIAMLDHPEFDAYDVTSLRTGIMAGAPCPPELLRRVIAEMHCPDILIGYGETEASPLTHLTTRDDSEERRVNTVGRNLPHQEVKVVNLETGRTVAMGEIGEICFRGYHIMRGYYGDPEATADVLDESGWLSSGDLGTMDQEGYVRVTGRRKEMIIRGGENIYPREIEDLLFTHPKVAEAAVFGLPDSFFGEEVAAWIELQPGQSMTEDEVRQFCKDKIAHFKIPKHIRFTDEFPMTVTGKVQKFRLRELMLEK